jgi:hypothetical protein
MLPVTTQMDLSHVLAIVGILVMEPIVLISTNVTMQRHLVIQMLLVIIWMDLTCVNVLKDMMEMERPA